MCAILNDIAAIDSIKRKTSNKLSISDLEDALANVMRIAAHTGLVLSGPSAGVNEYAPSLVAALAIFLARYVKSPSQKPWIREISITEALGFDIEALHIYTQYQPSNLSECVKALHALVCECLNSSLPAIWEK
ncbi:cyclin A1,1 [Tanacetum coccineum]